MRLSKIVLNVLVCAGILFPCGTTLAASGESISFSHLADAIYKAEGGARTRHLYGILQKYKHTSPRQACLNTIRHKYSDWVAQGSHGEFLAYLASKYAPQHVLNDPTGLNKFWLGNVTRFYKEGL